MYYIIRLLTLAIYFLPFSFLYVSCDGNVYSTAEIEKMREDSIKKITYIDEAADSTLIDIDTAITINDTFKHTFADSLLIVAGKFLVGGINILKSIDTIYNKKTINIPNKKSISGIYMTQKFVNTFGKICIWASIILTILSLVAEWLFRKKEIIIKGLLFINLLSVSAFIVNAYSIKVELRYGVWCLLAILIIQLALEIKRTISTNDS